MSPIRKGLAARVYAIDGRGPPTAFADAVGELQSGGGPLLVRQGRSALRWGFGEAQRIA